jgi:hypothetical protein
MRPIDKGVVPMVNGSPKTVANYRDWRRDLMDRIGNYCCYCNMVLNDSPQVEHVIAQDIDPARSTDWDNMLLACGPCNRTKSNKACSPMNHYLPQFHNTHLAFSFSVVRHPRSSEHAAFILWRGLPALQANAENTIALCALNEDTTKKLPQATDLRWKYRYETQLTAAIWKKEWTDWGHSNAQAFLRLLIAVVEGKGFWSLWFDAFADVALVRQALVQQFPGTASACFDADFNPISRNPPNPI